MFGYTLFGEALLTILLVAFGTMLVFHLSAQLSGSRWVADQRLTIQRMQRQSVPIVLGRGDQEEAFRHGFPLVYDYVQTRYRLAAESTFGGEQSFLVFVDAQVDPDGEYPDLGLPCYREMGGNTYGIDRGNLNLSALTGWAMPPGRRPTAHTDPHHPREH